MAKKALLYLYIFLLFNIFSSLNSFSEEINLIIDSKKQIKIHTKQKNFLLSYYKKTISAADGARCPMFPSCSAYCFKAIKKHGWLLGWIMSCDRLLRCGRDELKLCSKIFKNNESFCYDPVENNEFWIDKKKQAN